MAKVVSVFGTKGGVGKTLIAANLGVALAKENNKKVLLLDLDTEAVGDMCHMLGASSHRTLLDILEYIDKGNTNIEKGKFINTTSWGADFLPAIARPNLAKKIQASASKVSHIIKLIGSYYDFIIIDAGRSFSELLLEIFDTSSLILYIVTPDVLSIYQTKWALDTLERLNFPSSMIKIVLNRSEAASSININKIRSVLPSSFICELPSEGKIVMLSVNKGIPVVIDSPRSKMASAIRKFSIRLAQDDSLFIDPVEISQLRLNRIRPQFSGEQEFWEKLAFVERAEDRENEYEREDEILMLKKRIHNRLIQALDLKRLDLKTFDNPERIKDLREKAQSMVINFLAQEAKSFISSLEVRKKFAKEIIDEALGLGPLEDLLRDSDITEIMVNNKDEIYIERNGKVELTNKRFISNEQVRVTIERIIAPLGRHIDETVPMVDARLPDGSRVNAIIHPLSLTGPTLTIRKFRKTVFTVEDLVRLESLTWDMAEFLRACVLLRKNIVISGGTGSGKTTTLNALSSFIPDNERIITIEDAAELKLNQRHWVRLEARPSNIEGRGEITVRDLFRNTLRMRPDRIIIGECRGKEALDMLQAMNTGHDGSMTTIHANSTHDVFVRLDSMILMSGVELPIRAIREMITSAINIIVHTQRLSDGRRKVVQVTEVVGMKDDLHISLEDIFCFKQRGVDEKGNVLGEFTSTGYTPSFFKEIEIKGIKLSPDIFKSHAPDK